MPIEVSCSIESMNSWKISVTTGFDTLETRAIATDSRLISSCDIYFITSAAASWPIDSITTADFSMSVSCLCGLNSAASVTGDPSSDDLGRARRVVVGQVLHGFRFDAEHVLGFGADLR